MNRTGRVVGASPLEAESPNTAGVEAYLHFHCASGPKQDPVTRAHVRLLGPCFKTGRVGDRPTRREPPEPHAGRILTNGATRRPSTRRVGRPHGGSPVGAPAQPQRGGDGKVLTGTHRPRSGVAPRASWITTSDEHEERHWPPSGARPYGRLAQLPNRLRRPRGGRKCVGSRGDCDAGPAQ